MKKWCTLLFPFLIGASFLCGYAAPQDRQYVDYFLRLQAADLFRKRSFLLNWSCAYVNQNRIQGVDLCFSCSRTLSLKQARKLLVVVAEELVKNINSDSSIRERKLLPEPFTLNQLYIKIDTDNVFSAQADVENVRTMCLDRGNISYETYPASTLFYGRTTSFQETLEFARMLVGEPSRFQDVAIVLPQESDPSKVQNGALPELPEKTPPPKAELFISEKTDEKPPLHDAVPSANMRIALDSSSFPEAAATNDSPSSFLSWNDIPVFSKPQADEDERANIEEVLVVGLIVEPSEADESAEETTSHRCDPLTPSLIEEDSFGESVQSSGRIKTEPLPSTPSPKDESVSHDSLADVYEPAPVATPRFVLPTESASKDDKLLEDAPEKAEAGQKDFFVHRFNNASPVVETGDVEEKDDDQKESSPQSTSVFSRITAWFKGDQDNAEQSTPSSTPLLKDKDEENSLLEDTPEIVLVPVPEFDALSKNVSEGEAVVSETTLDKAEVVQKDIFVHRFNTASPEEETGDIEEKLRPLVEQPDVIEDDSVEKVLEEPQTEEAPQREESDNRQTPSSEPDSLVSWVVAMLDGDQQTVEPALPLESPNEQKIDEPLVEDCSAPLASPESAYIVLPEPSKDKGLESLPSPESVANGEEVHSLDVELPESPVLERFLHLVSPAATASPSFVGSEIVSEQGTAEAFVAVEPLTIESSTQSTVPAGDSSLNQDASNTVLPLVEPPLTEIVEVDVIEKASVIEEESPKKSAFDGFLSSIRVAQRESMSEQVDEIEVIEEEPVIEEESPKGSMFERFLHSIGIASKESSSDVISEQVDEVDVIEEEPVIEEESPKGSMFERFLHSIGVSPKGPASEEVEEVDVIDETPSPTTETDPLIDGTSQACQSEKPDSLTQFMSWAFVAPRNQEVVSTSSVLLDTETKDQPEESGSWVRGVTSWIVGDRFEEHSVDSSSSDELSDIQKDPLVFSEKSHVASRLGDVSRPDETWEDLDEEGCDDDGEEAGEEKQGMVTGMFSSIHSAWNSVLGMVQSSPKTSPDTDKSVALNTVEEQEEDSRSS